MVRKEYNQFLRVLLCVMFVVSIHYHSHHLIASNTYYTHTRPKIPPPPPLSSTKPSNYTLTHPHYSPTSNSSCTVLTSSYPKNCLPDGLHEADNTEIYGAGLTGPALSQNMTPPRRRGTDGGVTCFTWRRSECSGYFTSAHLEAWINRGRDARERGRDLIAKRRNEQEFTEREETKQ
jgi:hypothetical protein